MVVPVARARRARGPCRRGEGSRGVDIRRRTRLRLLPPASSSSSQCAPSDVGWQCSAPRRRSACGAVRNRAGHHHLHHDCGPDRLQDARQGQQSPLHYLGSATELVQGEHNALLTRAWPSPAKSIKGQRRAFITAADPDRFARSRCPRVALLTRHVPASLDRALSSRERGERWGSASHPFRLNGIRSLRDLIRPFSIPPSGKAADKSDLPQLRLMVERAYT